MIADVDVCLSPTNIFLSVNFVWNKIKLAKRPRPELQELVAYRAIFFSDEEGNEDTGKVENHEKGEHEEHPDDV